MGKNKYRSKRKSALAGKIIIYLILVLITLIMLVPFLWMLSASIKSNREVFLMDPFVWIPEVPKWDNYIRIWTKIPLLRFVGNTVFLTIVVTLLQLLTSSFAAYSFAKLEFKHKNGLFSGIYRHNRHALAGIHGTSVHHDEGDGAE